MSLEPTSSATSAPAAPPSRQPLGARIRGRVLLVSALLVLANAAAWMWALLAFHRHPLLLGTALLAYSFGLRHALDADHIAAIDNVTRKLMQQGRRPVSVGLFFSMGHSTVVFALSLLIAATSMTIKSHFESFTAIGGMIGTSVSVLFLFAIALANMLVLFSVYKMFRRVRRGEQLSDENLNAVLSGRGFFARIFRGLFQMIKHGWQMYLVGFLFGLGFDTATEIGLLGISAAGATQGLSVWAILIFPTLFAAGMALVDFTVNILMLSAYGWAYVKPVRKLYYNMMITLLSVLVALLVGGVELLGLISGRLELHGWLWDAVGALNEHSGIVGLTIIGIFAASWCASLLFFKMKKL